jgi:hypothetical protein
MSNLNKNDDDLVECVSVRGIIIDLRDVSHSCASSIMQPPALLAAATGRAPNSTPDFPARCE